MITRNDVLSAISSGTFDNDLDLIVSSINNRRDSLKNAKAISNRLTFSNGQRVILSRNLRPKYLAGEIAEFVSDLGNGSARVKLLNRYAISRAVKYATPDGLVSVPFSLLDPVATVKEI